MTEIILFIITLGFITGQSLAEARQDFWVILFKDDSRKLKYGGIKNRWKFWGNFYELAWLSFYCITVLYFLGSWSVLFWIPILWLIRTIFHDGFIALFLDEKFTYVSDNGFDGAMKSMCLGSGAVYLGVKIFILSILIMSYLSVLLNWDFWQMILNIFR